MGTSDFQILGRMMVSKYGHRSCLFAGYLQNWWEVIYMVPRVCFQKRTHRHLLSSLPRLFLCSTTAYGTPADEGWALRIWLCPTQTRPLLPWSSDVPCFIQWSNPRSESSPPWVHPVSHSPSIAGVVDSMSCISPDSIHISSLYTHNSGLRHLPVARVCPHRSACSNSCHPAVILPLVARERFQKYKPDQVSPPLKTIQWPAIVLS